MTFHVEEQPACSCAPSDLPESFIAKPHFSLTVVPTSSGEPGEAGEEEDEEQKWERERKQRQEQRQREQEEARERELQELERLEREKVGISDALGSLKRCHPG